MDDYGHPIHDFTRTASMWSTILGVEVTAPQVAICMILVKVSRETHKHKRDNLVDIAGYARTLEMVYEHGS
jgi:precorrin-4 methylase